MRVIDGFSVKKTLKLDRDYQEILFVGGFSRKCQIYVYVMTGKCGRVTNLYQ